jgi:hypothetical protein
MEGASVARGRSGWVTLVGVLFLIGGFFNLIWGLVGVGVSLGGTEATVLGDMTSDSLRGLGIAGIAIGGLQLFTGAGILSRAKSAWIVGIVLAVAAILVDFAYHRVLDGWAMGGLLVNFLILIVLAMKEGEFK